MKRLVYGTALLILVVGLSGCGDNFESLRKQQIQTVSEAVTVLGTVRDQASADAAKPKLKQLGDRWRDLEKRMGSVKVSADEESRVKGQYDKELNDLIGRYVGEAVRVAFVPGGKAALDEVGEIKKGK